MQINSPLPIPKTDTRFNLDGILCIPRAHHSLDVKRTSKNVQVNSLGIFGQEFRRWWFAEFLGEILALWRLVFLKISVHENELKGSLKYKLLDLNFRVSDLEGEIERSVSWRAPWQCCWSRDKTVITDGLECILHPLETPQHLGRPGNVQGKEQGS